MLIFVSFNLHYWNKKSSEKGVSISRGSKLILSPHETQARASYFGAELCQNIKTVYGVADEVEPCSWCKLLKKLKVRSVQCSLQFSRAPVVLRVLCLVIHSLESASSSRELSDTPPCFLDPQDCQEKHQHHNYRI